MPKLERVLISNRGEIAIRIAKTAHALGMESVSVYPSVDEQALHTRYTSYSHRLQDAGDDVAAYLNIDAIIDAAQHMNCDCIHPGYGFLSENPEFARRCEASGITLVGPGAQALALFGDKVAARELAKSLEIPVIPGSEAVLKDADDAAGFAEQIGYPVMLKAAAGGGGRGMRRVDSAAELPESFARCASEALASFGNGALFLEKCIPHPRHIEVQILADHEGHAVHLYERDCSVQLRHQKVLEIAPAPNLQRELAGQMHSAALAIVQAQPYAGAATVEFLLDPDTNNYYFIECNPRLQVEHTVTEQVTAVDIVEAQFQIAGGATLADIGLSSQSGVNPARGFSIQARIVAQGVGTITAYREPSGAGIRVDSCGYLGYTPPPQFDPLLAKLIVSAGSTYPAALARAKGALADFQIAGLATNLAQLESILRQPSVLAGDARTSLLGDAAPAGAPATTSEALAFLARQATLVGAGTALAAVQGGGGVESASLTVPSDQRGVQVPMDGSVVELSASAGAEVALGDTLLVISAMKMESMITAPCAGTVTAVADLQPDDSVGAGQIVVTIDPAAETGDQPAAYGQNSWGPTLEEVATLKQLATARLAPGSSDPGVVRQRARGKLTCRERIDLLLDEGSFREVGSVAGFASYDESGEIDAFTPANMVGGWGSIEKRTTIVCADDFTSRGGHADGAIAAKSTYLDRLAMEMRIPSIRLLDGSSGGGSVAAMVPAQKKSGSSTAKESSGAIKAGRPRVAGGGGSFLPGHLGSTMYAEQLSQVPVVNMLLGSVVGIGAAKAVLGHFSVMVKDVAQLFVAGPPVVSHAMGYEITKEDLGGWHIHCRNGSVDNLADDEAHAATIVRRFLSYLPSSAYETAHRLNANPNDPASRREEELFTLIPRKRTTTFNMRRAIELMADRDSFFEIGPLWGTDQIVGFARFNGHTVGVIASDSQHVNGGALTAQGCEKLTRHLDLCDLFHIPLVNLIDNPGFAVGLEHEIAGTIRKGAEWMVAFAQTTIPIFTVVMRRSFGVAGNNYATPRSRPSMRVVWPAADVGGIPPEGGIEAAYKRQLAEAEDPVALRAELEARIESARGPVGPLNKFQMEEMIDPRDTRRYICDWVELAYNVVTQTRALGPRALGFRP